MVRVGLTFGHSALIQIPQFQLSWHASCNMTGPNRSVCGAISGEGEVLACTKSPNPKAIPHSVHFRGNVPKLCPKLDFLCQGICRKNGFSLPEISDSILDRNLAYFPLKWTQFWTELGQFWQELCTFPLKWTELRHFRKDPLPHFPPKTKFWWP